MKQKKGKKWNDDITYIRELAFPDCFNRKNINVVVKMCQDVSLKWILPRRDRNMLG